MSSTAQITVHQSQFPGNVRRELLQCLRTRRINPKFHYDSLKQTQKWLELHRAYSPSRQDPDCLAVYDQAFQETALLAGSRPVHLIGLGCGGGQKDTHLLRLLGSPRGALRYSPCDVSTAMVLVARETALTALPKAVVTPLVCDLAAADDLPALFAGFDQPEMIRVITFFGMIPNFEPNLILPRVAALVRPGDVLLLGANLVPDNSTSGIQCILPQYDNALTRDWLMLFLTDLGFERADGELRFGIEQHESIQQLQRIDATFRFVRNREIRVDTEKFSFSPGESLHLFYSYRYTPALVIHLLKRYGLSVRKESITRSREEAVFACVQTADLR